MTGRELGSMLIANDVIQIIETEVKDPDAIEDRQNFLQLVGPDLKLLPQGQIIVTEWWALVQDMPIAYACLTERTKDEVQFFVVVRPDRRGVGLGKLMIRCATDQAIRHRKRIIVAVVKPDNLAYHILEEEEFEPDGDTLRKVLKWQ